jgi:hypothetical protein
MYCYPLYQTSWGTVVAAGTLSGLSLPTQRKTNREHKPLRIDELPDSRSSGRVLAILVTTGWPLRVRRVHDLVAETLFP